MSDLVERYLALGLALGRHIDGLVDAYYGPPEIAARVEAEPPRDPATLAGDAATLHEHAPSQLEPGRARWLGAQLVGLETVARKLAGEEIPFADEVERCYGVRPLRVPEEQFERAHAELDEALPGNGPLAERYQAWREGDGVQGEELRTVIEAVSADLRSRTGELFGLPTGESVRWDFVTDEPWAAFNYYEGDLHSRIAVNVDVPVTPPLLLELVAHETYPGHHVEHVWKEQLLVREGGQIEEAIYMVGTPQSLINEGIASLAADILLGDEADAVTARHVAAAGREYDVELARAVKHARELLEGVTRNAVLMLHEDGASEEETRDYLMRWALSTQQRAEHNVRFMTDPVWRSYISTYTDGLALCRDWVAGDPARFRRLLTEQLSPADLLAPAG